MKRTSEAMIVAALVGEYGISKGIAKGVLKRVIAEMQETVNASKPHRRAQMIASLDRLYEQCIAKGRLGTAVDVQRLLAKVDGTEAPTKHIFGGRVAGAPAVTEAAKQVVGTMDDPEFDGRSVEDLDYYADNGMWPEDGPESEDGPQPATPEFPLH